MSDRCIVNQYISEDMREDVRQIVGCDKFPLTYNRPHHYCPIHDPSHGKGDTSDYQNAVRSKLESGELYFDYGILPDLRAFTTATAYGFVSFTKAMFGRVVRLDYCDFRRKVIFKQSRFDGDLRISGARFREGLVIDGPELPKDLSVQQCRFDGPFSVDGDKIEGDAIIRSNIYRDSVSFRTRVGGDADFNSSEFQGVADFIGAKFEGSASFSSSQFRRGVNFHSAGFGGDLSLSSSLLEGDAVFNFSIFASDKLARFDQTRFRGHVSFDRAELNGFMIFEGGEGMFQDHDGALQDIPYTRCFEGSSAKITMDYARIPQPSRISFRDVRLEPYWFMGTDPKDFNFQGTRWLTDSGQLVSGRNQFRKLLPNKAFDEVPRLVRVCHRLGSHSEEFGQFDNASLFRQMAFDVMYLDERRRFESWRRSLTGVLSKGIPCKGWADCMVKTSREVVKRTLEMPRFGLLLRLYRSVSGFGESWIRAAMWLIAIWFFGAIAFRLFGEFVTTSGTSIGLAELIFPYTPNVMIFQKPEPRPANVAAQAINFLLLVSTPVVGALLVLAIRRKFMK